MFERRKKLELVLIFFLGILFTMMNWLTDLFRDWVGLENNLRSCAYNGLFEICNPALAYHITWYASMIIFYAVIVWLMMSIMDD